MQTPKEEKSQQLKQCENSFKFNFWLKPKTPYEVPKSMNGHLFQQNDNSYLLVDFSQNNQPVIHILKCSTFEIEDSFEIDCSECPLINYEFLNHQSIFVNNRIYLVCSQNPRENQHVYIIDILQKKLFPIKNIDTRPQEFRIKSSIVLHNYKLLLFGGFTEQLQMLNTLESFDISTYRWEKISTKGRAPLPRHSHVACVHADRMIIMGGTNSTDIWSKESQFQDIFVLDLRNSVWLQIKTEGFLMPQLMNYSYIVPIISLKTQLLQQQQNEIETRNKQKLQQQQQQYIYISKNPMSSEFQLYLFTPQTYTFSLLDAYSQKPDFRYNPIICFNKYTEQLIIYGGFAYERIQQDSIGNEFDTFSMFRENQPELFEKLEIMGDKKKKNREKNNSKQLKSKESSFTKTSNNKKLQKEESEKEEQDLSSESDDDFQQEEKQQQQQQQQDLLEENNQEYELTFEELLEMEKKNLQNEQQNISSSDSQPKKKKKNNNNKTAQM